MINAGVVKFFSEVSESSVTNYIEVTTLMISIKCPVAYKRTVINESNYHNPSSEGISINDLDY